jgi:hypothetical protein
VQRSEEEFILLASQVIRTLATRVNSSNSTAQGGRLIDPDNITIKAWGMIRGQVRGAVNSKTGRR